MSCGVCYVPLVPTFSHPFFLSLPLLLLFFFKLSERCHIGFLRKKENQNSFTKLQFHLTFHCSVAVMKWS